MSTISNNVAARNAALILQGISKEKAGAYSSLATGLRISKASDNPSFWSIAQSLRSDSSMVSAAHDAIRLSASIVEVAYQGTEQALSILQKIRDLYVLAEDPAIKRAVLEKQLKSLTSDLLGVVMGSSFSDENWLYRDSNTSLVKRLVAGVTRNGDGEISVQSIDVDLGSILLVDAFTANSGLMSTGYSPTPEGTTFFKRKLFSTIGPSSARQFSFYTLRFEDNRAKLEEQLYALNTMLASVSDAMTGLGAFGARIQSQDAWLGKIESIAKTGIGRLVDTDMEEATARLRAIDTREQLAYQSLHMANQAHTAILDLFR